MLSSTMRRQYLYTRWRHSKTGRLFLPSASTVSSLNIPLSVVLVWVQYMSNYFVSFSPTFPRDIVLQIQSSCVMHTWIIVSPPSHPPSLPSPLLSSLSSLSSLLSSRLEDNEQELVEVKANLQRERSQCLHLKHQEETTSCELDSLRKQIQFRDGFIEVR